MTTSRYDWTKLLSDGLADLDTSQNPWAVIVKRARHVGDVEHEIALSIATGYYTAVEWLGPRNEINAVVEDPVDSSAWMEALDRLSAAAVGMAPSPAASTALTPEMVAGSAPQCRDMARVVADAVRTAYAGDRTKYELTPE